MQPLSPASPALETYPDALAFLDGLDVSAMKLGLERISRLLDVLGNPQDALPMVHVAGTNGKGSVTAMLSSVLKAAGYKTGSFISPHLVHVRERIAVNGNPILADDFTAGVNALKTTLEALNWPREDWPTYFEFLNVMAYQYFRQQGADVTVFETGLGGRLDSTNVVHHPNLTVITTIGMDHMQHLGHTLAEIAGEKVGILKAGSPLVLGAKLPPEARTVILQKAEALGGPVTVAETEGWQVSTASNPHDGLLLENADGHHYRLGLLGPYQKDNMAIVLACVAQLRGQGFVIDEAAVSEGLAHALWPARFQFFAGQNILLDGSHNADGFRALADGLDLYFKQRPFYWLISLRNNRDPQALLDVIARFGPPLGVVVTQAQPTRLYHDPQTLAAAVSAVPGLTAPVVTAENPLAAMALLKEGLRAHASKAPLGIVTGSLYTAGEALAALEGGAAPPQAQA